MSHQVTFAKSRSRSTPKIRAVTIGTKDDITLYKKYKIPDNRVVTSKYTLLTFIPKNLFEQFRRIANFYFLCVALIQSTTNSPVSPVTSLTPLIFVVTTTAIKQAYEDWLRHKHDKAVNNKSVYVVTSHGMEKRRSEQIHIGDVVRVEDNDEIPCDMVMLSSSDSQGKCHITTANLDGETNLKVRHNLPNTQKLDSSSDFNNFQAVIECENPNTDLYDFVGVMRVFDREANIDNEFPLGPNNLLLRGARLKNTAFIYGTAVYTGQETKMALNSRLTSNKFSSVERTVNKYLLVYLAVLLIISFVCTLLRFISLQDYGFNAWYLEGLPMQEGGVKISSFFTEFLAFFVIFNYLIPISLYVTLELVKFFGSKSLVADPNLIEADNPEQPICNTSDLNEELGQVEYLFSDKTGTLTDNLMIFRSCTIDGVSYEELDGKLVNVATESTADINEQIDVQKFLIALALCNTAQVNVREEIIPSSSDSSEIYEYQAASPDEKALVEASHRFGITLSESNDKYLTLKINSTTLKYQRLKTFEFDSVRKRMSVIVKNDDGEIWLICKGSDSSVAELITDGELDTTLRQVDEYANHGLRTLLVSMKKISEKDYADLEANFHTASVSLEKRKEKLIACQRDVEKDLTILGATAIEDQLQEGVSETIQDLKEAGIKVWVLTGDKLETAVSVAFSCSLLTSSMIQIHLARQQNADSCGELLNRYLTVTEDSSPNEYAFITDGRSLYMAMKFHKKKFQSLCQRCQVVLCCRMSPIQKAEVVKLMKELPSRPVTAAIGDGANDVSMLQEAHVGFGVMGKEGRQAVNSSDFAFAKFRFVKPILLVHGHYFYQRVSVLIQYFFYKNVVFITPQFLYAFVSAFSAQTIYHSSLLMLYNMMFTAGPILVYALVEKHIPPMVLMNYPEFYKKIRRNANMTSVKFLQWFVCGFWHGLVIFLGFWLLYGSEISLFSNGQFGGVFAFGTLLYTCVIFIVTFKLVIISCNLNRYFIAVIIISLLSLPFVLTIYSSFKWNILDDDLYGIYTPYLFSASFWLTTFVLVCLALSPDFACLVIKNTFNTLEFSEMMEKKKMSDSQ